jgi:hypothetical protein
MPKSIVLVTNTGESSELSRKSSKFDRNILQSFQEVLRFDSRPWSGQQRKQRARWAKVKAQQKAA